MVELRKSIQVKIAPGDELDSYILEYADAVNFGLGFVFNIYSKYCRVEEEGVCSNCGKTTQTQYEHISGERICPYCFKIAWGEYTLRPQLIAQMRLQYPNLSVYGSHYNAPLRHIFGIFKSYVSKLEAREKELKTITEECQDALLSGEADYSVSWRPGLPREQQRLCIDWYPSKLKKLRKLRTPISFPVFRGNTIRFWKGFAGIEPEGFSVWVKDLKTKGEKHVYDSRYGGYQEKHVLENIDRLPTRYYSIHRQKGKYYLDVPYVKDVDLLAGDQLLESISEKSKVFVAVFGVNEPLQLYLFQEGVCVDVKCFGGEDFITEKNRRRELNRCVLARINSRHEDSPEKIRRQKKKWWRKVRDSQRRWITDYLNNLTFQAAEYVRDNGGDVVVMRQTKGFSKLNYPPALNKVLHGWPLVESQAMLEYKLAFRGIPTYFIRHKEVSDLVCGCGEKYKVLTLKLKNQVCFSCDCGAEIDLYCCDAYNLCNVFQSHLLKNSKGPSGLKPRPVR